MEITERSNGETIQLAVGQTFTLKLNEISGTGFRWQFVRDGAPAVSVLDDSFQGNSQHPGAGGMREWLLKAVSPGNVTIELKLSRQWEPDSATRSLLFHLSVT